MEQELFANEDQIIKIILIAIGLLTVMSSAIVVFFYFSRKKITKTELEKANLEISHQKEIIQSTLITQEEERSRIAQNLHDAISSKLNVVSLNANILVEEGISSEEANQIGSSILKVSNTVLESSRKIAHDLLPATLAKFGLQPALEELCEDLEETKKFNGSFDFKYEEGFLPSEMELQLFRIVQELISNTIKHADASDIAIYLKTSKNILSFVYSDNGKGMDLESVKRAKGLGMSGIDNRVVILQGTLDIQSSPGNGILLTIEIKK